MCYKHAYHPKWGRHHRHGRGKWAEHFKDRWAQPPVNIREYDDHYELWLYAAGYAKDDFKVLMKNDTLLIAVENQENDIIEDFDWRRREFRPPAFKRRFELNEKVDKDGIKAQYEDGILKVTLPKRAGFETTSSEVIVG